MSHFSQIKTSIRDLLTLKAVLSQLNISWKEDNWHSSKVVKIALEQPNGVVMFFNFNGQEYEFMTDISFWQQTYSVESFVSKINQTYTSRLLNDELSNLGFSAIQCVKTEKGALDLVVERWSTENMQNRSNVMYR